MPSDYTPQRVVSLQPSATLILQAIGKLDRLAACTKYCADVCPEVAQISRIIVADSWTAQSEQILSARPDLVIASVPYQEKAVTEILKSGARFLGFAPKTLADIYRDIACIAGIMGASIEGSKIIALMQQQIEETRVQAAAARGSRQRPRVYCEEWGKPLIASQRWVAELVDAAGGKFVGTPGAIISAEAVLAEDPDVMIAAWCGARDRVPLEKVMGKRGWHETKLAREGRVYCINDELLNTPAPSLVHGLRALAAALWPESFPLPQGLRQITNVRDA
ncbi:MAG TPA: ABC transporter substrate-binding protein [Terriglobales bacterium]|nr:ABC transporter substrate-binding protein [Terriglobales bacterium]